MSEPMASQVDLAQVHDIDEQQLIEWLRWRGFNVSVGSSGASRERTRMTRERRRRQRDRQRKRISRLERRLQQAKLTLRYDRKALGDLIAVTDPVIYPHGTTKLAGCRALGSKALANCSAVIKAIEVDEAQPELSDRVVK